MHCRLKQHNGELKGGAKASHAGRPWVCACLIQGFHGKSEGSFSLIWSYVMKKSGIFFHIFNIISKLWFLQLFGTVNLIEKIIFLIQEESFWETLRLVHSDWWPWINTPISSVLGFKAVCTYSLIPTVIGRCWFSKSKYHFHIELKAVCVHAFFNLVMIGMGSLLIGVFPYWMPKCQIWKGLASLWWLEDLS